METEIKIKFLSDSKCHTSTGGKRMSLTNDIFLYCLPSKLPQLLAQRPRRLSNQLLEALAHASSKQCILGHCILGFLLGA